MKLKIKVLFLLIISIIIGCNNSKKTGIELTKGYAIVEGKISNYENGSKVLSFAGETIAGEINQTAILDSLGNFKTEIELFNPQNVMLFYENGFAYLFLKPNDSLFINVDVNLLKGDYELSGSNPKTSENMRDFLKFKGPYSYEPKYGDSVSAKDYLSDLEQQMVIEDSILNEFNKQYIPTEEFMYWAKKKMIYGLANQLLLYFWYFDVNHKQYKSEIYDNDLFPVDDDSAIVCGNYLVHLKDYLYNKYYADSAFTKYTKKKEVTAAYTYLIDRLIKTEKPGLSRDILIYKVFLHVLEIPIEYRAGLWERYEHFINNQELVNILQEKKLRIENQDSELETTLDLKLNTESTTIEKFWESISTKHKDKIIYIDIWATWCGPCRSEIPHAIELHNYFEGKPVAFVNLCLASKKEDWKKSIAQNHIKGDNYFFNEDETKLLREELKFHGYPTYMIMDKKGNLINKNAPRPSSWNEIIGVLNKLLEE